MKRDLLIILFSAFALCLLADAPQQYSINGSTVARIASVDAYDFNWLPNNSTPTIIESDYAMMGKYCQLTSANSSGNMYLSGFYGDFKIPIHIDLTTGSVTIKAGNNRIDSLSSIELVDPFSSTIIAGRPHTWPEIIKESVERKLYPDLDTIDASSWEFELASDWTLYAMPLSRLMGLDDSDTIHGQVNDDGTISFNDDFVLLVKRELPYSYAGHTTWSMSPIFRNLKLLIPNGTHKFQYAHMTPKYKAIATPGPEGSGNGGRVPRPTNTRPGSSKPVSSFAQVFEAGSPSLNYKPNSGLKPEPYPEPYPELNPSAGGSHPYTCNHRIYLLVQYVDTTTEEEQPIYWSVDSSDSTTLMVYNLFGQGNRCYLKINNGTIELPSQQIYNDGLGDVLFNNSCTGLRFGNSISLGGIISVIGKDRPKFSSNLLLFGDGSPFIASPGHDSCVERGDVNNDGVVNSSDVTALIHCVLSESQDGVNYENADCTLDGTNNISDVTTLINYLLNGNWPE